MKRMVLVDWAPPADPEGGTGSVPVELPYADALSSDYVRTAWTAVLGSAFERIFSFTGNRVIPERTPVAVKSEGSEREEAARENLKRALLLASGTGDAAETDKSLFSAKSFAKFTNLLNDLLSHMRKLPATEKRAVAEYLRRLPATAGLKQAVSQVDRLAGTTAVEEARSQVARFLGPYVAAQKFPNATAVAAFAGEVRGSMLDVFVTLFKLALADDSGSGGELVSADFLLDERLALVRSAAALGAKLATRTPSLGNSGATLEAIRGSDVAFAPQVLAPNKGASLRTVLGAFFARSAAISDCFMDLDTADQKLAPRFTSLFKDHATHVFNLAYGRDDMGEIFMFWLQFYRDWPFFISKIGREGPSVVDILRTAAAREDRGEIYATFPIKDAESVMSIGRFFFTGLMGRFTRASGILRSMSRITDPPGAADDQVAKRACVWAFQKFCLYCAHYLAVRQYSASGVERIGRAPYTPGELAEAGELLLSSAASLGAALADVHATRVGAGGIDARRLSALEDSLWSTMLLEPPHQDQSSAKEKKKLSMFSLDDF